MVASISQALTGLCLPQLGFSGVHSLGSPMAEVTGHSIEGGPGQAPRCVSGDPLLLLQS